MPSRHPSRCLVTEQTDRTLRRSGGSKDCCPRLSFYKVCPLAGCILREAGRACQTPTETDQLLHTPLQDTLSRPLRTGHVLSVSSSQLLQMSFFGRPRCPRFPAARYLTQSTKALCRGILDGLAHLDSNCTDKKNPLLSVLFTRSVRKRLLRGSDPRCRFRPPRAERIRPFRPSVYLSLPSSSRTVGL